MVVFPLPRVCSLAILWAILIASCTTINHTSAFAPSGRSTRIASTSSAIKISPSERRSCSSRPPRPIATLFGSNNDDDGGASDNAPLQRFLSPRIDDPGLPLTEVLLAQIVAPTFQIYWIALNHAPNPSWLQPISSYFGSAPELAPRGSLLAPTLIHGAGLAVCWLAGALAARSFEREAFTVKGTGPDAEEGSEYNNNINNTGGGSVLDVIGKYDTVLVRLFQAGAFASGILIFSTQLDLLLEFKRYIQYGESPETDLRLAVATVEVINDIFWEALVIGSWRIIHANFMSTPSNRMKEF